MACIHWEGRAKGLEFPTADNPVTGLLSTDLGIKLCYAFGGAPYQITGSALGFFLQMYLLDVAQLDPFNASIILFVGRAWDAVTDPTVGFLVSRSPWTRWGRMMPWCVGGRGGGGRGGRGGGGD
ncbi:hypothetical protein JZ751_018939 [Albula glossodonta]|uniref:Uncharacterized protein n=1 Tax=Albula glossodonta TaxID=121402 RepID=A0A8T2MW75_9TELE|nr:hypothetical protein JZ751_018939 [Albula glossodonta]